MKSFSILAIKMLALYLVLTTLYSFLPVVFSGNINTLLTPELMLFYGKKQSSLLIKFIKVRLQ